MSRLNRHLLRGRPALFVHVHGLRIIACALLLVCAMLNASCGFITQSEAGQRSTNNLTLSGNFPGGVTNQAYNSVLTVSGGTAPYQFNLKSGSLPAGVSLNATTGSVSGTPTAPGSYIFEVEVTDAPESHHGAQNFAISVSSGGGGRGIHVTVSPSSSNVTSGQTQNFTAAVTGTDNSAVTWTASAGSISGSGVFTAPAVSQVVNVYVTATSKADSKTQGLATIVVEPPSGQSLAIADTSLPDGRTGNTYDADFSATGGTSPYNWTVSQGHIPQGLSLSQSDGQLAGMPGTAGGYNFTIKVTDAKAKAATKSFSINIATGGSMDGPAELPRATVSSAMSDTPAPGATIPVNAGADLQAALNSAHCGDTIELQAGATFSGTFSLPAKSCDNAHWIIIRTSAPDSSLPAEGKRATPCFAGVSSLPGRPQFNCSNPQKVMAKIEYNKAAMGPIILRNGANHYRLMGLEITRTAIGRCAPTFISVEPGGVADHIIVDRSWLHGLVQEETQLGISLNGTNSVAVVDSYFNDFHCTAGTGTCSDSHAVAGGIGDHLDGPFKIENNFLEASGESVFFGGGAATVTPADIEIRRNHFYKPWQWMPGNAKFVGGVDGHPFVVKNHLELKNATRVLVEANIMENTWGGFSQTGYGVLLTPKNQHSQRRGNVCPLCQVTDVTIRYSRISHSAGGIQMATSNSGGGIDEGGGAALAGTRWSVHDLVIDDINRAYVGGGSLFEVLNGWPANPLNTVTINHITGFPDPQGHLFIMGNKAENPSMHSFVFTNNLVTTARYPVWNAIGGKTSCAASDQPVRTIATCFTTYTFGNNALLAYPPQFPPSSWPTGNLFAQDTRGAGFVQFDNGVGGNYALQSNSPYKNAGTDGRDLGADIAGLNAALAGVD
jgi:hypothetical protein